MNERRLVDHLDRARHIDGAAQRHRGSRGQQTGTGQHHRGSDPFTGDGKDVTVDCIETATADKDFAQPIGDQGQLIGWAGQRRVVDAEAVGCDQYALPQPSSFLLRCPRNDGRADLDIHKRPLPMKGLASVERPTIVEKQQFALAPLVVVAVLLAQELRRSASR